MSWIVTPQLMALNGIPQENILGIAFGGGYFAGYISHTANGNPTHALIVAPRATGQSSTPLQSKTSFTSTSGTDSMFNGVANTNAMVTSGINNHPAAKFCKDLTIGGYTDWYLPSIYELSIAYFNLKPGTTSNDTSWGANPYAVPRRNSNYTTTNPTQTSVVNFRTSAAESFGIDTFWTSTESSSTTSWGVNFNTGNERAFTKTDTLYVRAFRRITL